MVGMMVFAKAPLDGPAGAGQNATFEPYRALDQED